MDFHRTCYVHWYFRDLLWECLWASWVSFWQCYLPVTHLYFQFRAITSVNSYGFSWNLVCALIFWRFASGLLMGKFCQFLTELSASYTFIFLFQDNNFSKPQLIFIKLDMCIDAEEIRFGIANGQILSICDSYLPMAWLWRGYYSFTCEFVFLFCLGSAKSLKLFNFYSLMNVSFITMCPAWFLTTNVANYNDCLFHSCVCFCKFSVKFS